MIKLPAPELFGKVSLEEAIVKRRSVRQFRTQTLSREAIAQLMWAAQGVTDPLKGLRSAPSAGALYPIDLYLASSDGLFRYHARTHSLEQFVENDVRPSLAVSAFNQDSIAQAAITIIIVADYTKVKDHDGERGVRYTDMECGHIAQNIQLQAVVLGLASVPIGAFQTTDISATLELPSALEAVYLLPVGYTQ
jgi:SagB-type dehydrogenase family enzyme